MTIKGLKAFTILSDQTSGANEPWPVSLDTATEVRTWFDRARAGGYTFKPLPEHQAHMLKPNGQPDRIVWVEDSLGERVPLTPWL